MLELKELLYCLAISLQLSGAILIIHNSYNNLGRDNLIKNFLKNSVTTKTYKVLESEESALNYNHEAFLDFIHLQYKNFVSFIYIFMGYILGILGEIHNKILGIILIIIFTLFIIWMTDKFIKYKNSNIKKITTGELINLNIEPTLETASQGSIENLFKE